MSTSLESELYKRYQKAFNADDGGGALPYYNDWYSVIRMENSAEMLWKEYRRHKEPEG